MLSLSYVWDLSQMEPSQQYPECILTALSHLYSESEFFLCSNMTQLSELKLKQLSM